MGGILVCLTNAPAVDYLRIALRRLEDQGYDSVGVALRTTAGDTARLRAVGRVGALDRPVREWAGRQVDAVGIAYTRWAVHGSASEGTVHPHTDCSGRIALVHQGIIENAVSLRSELTRAGHKIATSVDSELLCHLIEDERRRCGDFVDAVRIALTRVEGSWTLAAMERGTCGIAVAAHGSPLLIADTSHGVFAASDVASIAEWADEFDVLDDGDVVDLDYVRLASPRNCREALSG
jgi:glucosamine--fructose-6-phosphate aminotransferase (isomerizing)